MRAELEFLRFAQALKSWGVEVAPKDILQDPTSAWGKAPLSERNALLVSLGFPPDSAGAAKLSVGKKAGAPKTVENVLVVFDTDGAVGAASAAPAVGAASAAPAVAAPTGAAAVTPAQPQPSAQPTTAAQPQPIEKTVEFPVFAGALKSWGVNAPVKDVLQNLEGHWGQAPLAPRDAWLVSIGFPAGCAANAKLTVGKKPGSEKRIENVLVQITATPVGAGAPSPTAAFAPLTGAQRDVEVYPIIEPHCYIRIVYDEGNHEHEYRVEEPPLTDWEQKVFRFIETTLVDIIEIGLADLTEKQASEVLAKHTEEVLRDYSIQLDEPQRSKLNYYVLRNFLGFGKIDALMRDALIEDISCDGPHQPIFIYHRKYESLKSNVRWKDHPELDSFVIRLAQRSGKHISIAEPLLDATLPDGSRLNATLAKEVTSGGSTFTIRKFRQVPFTPPDLIRFKTMSPEMLAYLWMAVQYGASAIYAGGTASGKTTSINAIMLFIPPQMKIVSIEDTRELNLPHPNWIAGTTRSGFGPRDDRGRQAGEIDMFTLLKAALRQRPEYIIVGEVRGAEAFALFQAMATGHTAYGTMHADSVESVIHRLESEPINVPRSLLEALDIVSVQIQTRIAGKRVRRTKEIVEIVGLDPHTREILTNEVFTWIPGRDEFEYSGVSYVLERIKLEKNMGDEEMRQELERRKEIIFWMMLSGVNDYKAVAEIVQAYYKASEATMGRIRDDMARFRAEGRVPEAATTTRAAEPPAKPTGI
ncbi:MAG: type II/IV secretion system ATPase subunit [Methanobacteriota archaeon]